MADSWTDRQRQAIVTDGRDILVAAAAGSGKTAVLTERIVRKITDREHPVDIDRLVVVTFTKAAAAQMKQRIRSRLEELAQSDPGNERIQMQLTLIHNAHITTIDSFCLDIVRNYFADIDLDPSFRTADDGEIALLESDIMEDLLEDYYARNDPAFFELVDAYGAGRDDSKLVELILKIYRFARSSAWETEWYDQCMNLYAAKRLEDLNENAAVQYLMRDIRQRLADYDSIYEQLEQICQSPMGPVMYLGAVMSDHALIRMLLSAEHFSDLLLLAQQISFDTLGRSGKKDVDEEKKGYVKQQRDAFKDFITKALKKKYLYAEASKCLADVIQSRPFVQMLLTLAKDFSDRMRQEKLRRNVIDFSDMEHFALDILIDRTDKKSTCTAAALALRAFYEEILIDEYQDSNLLQEVILSAIARGGEEQAGNMYMVGDVKQSIYKFRLACPELFIAKYDAFSDADEQEAAAQSVKKQEPAAQSVKKKKSASAAQPAKIELQTNFRSRRNVLECTNDVFAKLMNPDFCKMKYDDKVRLNAGFFYPVCQAETVWNSSLHKTVDFGTDQDTEIHLIDMTDMQGESGQEDEDANRDSVQAEAGRIAAIIAALVNNEGAVHMVYDKNAAGGYRPIQYRDIVVLSRSVTGWADKLVNVLMAKGIPAYSDASTGYFYVREIQLVLSYLRVINNPMQDISLAAVLMSYFGKLSAEELAVIRMGKKRETLYDCLLKIADEPSIEEELKDKVLQFITKLDKYREKSELLPVRDLLWHVIYDTGYYDYAGTMPAGTRRQANLDILLERAAAFEHTSYRGLFNFLRYVERMIAQDVDLGEASDIGENEDLVRVMTIHKSKGLEFPVVILAGMGKKINQRDAAAPLVIDQELGVGTDVVYLEKRIKNPTLIKTAISRKLFVDSVSEEMRVLYVAMTRAREKLIITGTVRDTAAALHKWKTRQQTFVQNRYSYTDLSGMNTYFDMLMPAVCAEASQNEGVFRIVTSWKQEEGYRKPGTQEEETNKEQETHKESGTQEEPGANEEREAYKETGEVCKEADANADKNKSKEAASIPVYPYPLDAGKKAKITVSELKQMQHEADFEKNALYAKQVTVSEEDAVKREHDAAKDAEEGTRLLEEIVPKFIRGAEKKLAGNERGTAYHRVMECLDYSGFFTEPLKPAEPLEAGEALKPKEPLKQTEPLGEEAAQANEEQAILLQIQDQIAQMLREEKLTPMQAKAVKAKDILKFCLSGVGRRVAASAKAGNLRREQPFVFIDRAYDDQQLIQGIIDLCFEEDGGFVIVDYKTDRVPRGKAGEQELKKRYALQLGYYAKALSQITGQPVKEKVIYSFTLGKEIPLTDESIFAAGGQILVNK